MTRTQMAGMTLATLVIGSSRGDPKEANLKQAMRDMTANIHSTTYKGLLQNSATRNATARVRVLFSAAAAANRKEPPEGIGFSPEQPAKTWIVVVRGDDPGQELVVEGYGEDLTKPLLVEHIPFPPD